MSSFSLRRIEFWESMPDVAFRTKLFESFDGTRAKSSVSMNLDQLRAPLVYECVGNRERPQVIVVHDPYRWSV